jgi:hypothetical protein
MGGGAGGRDDDKQRDQGEDGQGGEAQGAVHELELLAAPVQVFEPEVVQDKLGDPERRATHPAP